MSLSKVRMAPSRRPQQFSNWFRYCQEGERGVRGSAHQPPMRPQVSFTSQGRLSTPWALGLGDLGGQPARAGRAGSVQAGKEEASESS